MRLAGGRGQKPQEHCRTESQLYPSEQRCVHVCVCVCDKERD